MELLKELPFESYRGNDIRYGHLDEDQETDLVLVQSVDRKITALTALTLEGKFLWQRGTPSLSRINDPGTDTPIQIIDFDGDQKDDVLYVAAGYLYILDGATGQEKNRATLPMEMAKDSLFVFPTRVKGPIDRVLIKDRYNWGYVFDQSLKLLWIVSGNLGHFPAFLDADADGQNEVMLGFRLFNGDGKLLWDIESQGSLRGHADAIAVGDLEGDGALEIAVATSNDAVVVNALTGEIRFKRPHLHTQHALIGEFEIDSLGQEVIFLDRELGTNTSVIYCYSSNGKLLWKRKNLTYNAIISKLISWGPNSPEDKIILFRTRDNSPVIIGRKGVIEEKISLPIFHSASIRKNSKRRFKNSSYVQHFDLSGDSRPEILINSQDGLWIYKNRAQQNGSILLENQKLPRERIFNQTFYRGN
jgi:outer membrane protein assembly factor BamB